MVVSPLTFTEKAAIIYPSMRLGMKCFYAVCSDYQLIDKGDDPPVSA